MPLGNQKKSYSGTQVSASKSNSVKRQYCYVFKSVISYILSKQNFLCIKKSKLFDNISSIYYAIKTNKT